ncbi:glycoside hydrolase family 127 protein [Glaciibacter superstes]|uniref:glycoside hydrolase family 127 protein n=1 Tax=Glaciibacter superstes TaxID=501023 RepID=UPI0003B45430|nr:beta-L-arabinofuranosidase domain-containing protein [Glaciibacter superstes]
MTLTTPSALRAVQPVSPSHTRLSPLGLRESVLDSDGYWGRRNRVNAEATLWHCEHWMERAGWLGNFDAAVAGTLPESRRGREFADSEIYKLLEAMSWEYGATGDAAIDASIRSITARVAAAQEADGYLNTNFGRAGQAPRYTDIEWGHELYNYGHLMQAAVARYRTSGPDALFDVAKRVADHVCDTFGDDGIQTVCGHPEIELGLMEFYRLTQDEKYLHQAQLFVERRGHGLLADIEWGRSYYQDDMPVREATVFRGHAVRALYLAAAAVDLAVETGDTELLATLETQWSNTIAARTYLTGGMGSHHQDEAFGEDFVLPSDRAYCETCAGVASVMLSWRLLLATGKSRYADLIERTLFNVVATSPAPDGRSFFYSNTLHQRAEGVAVASDVQVPRASSSLRAPWFDVSCCPTNVSRTLASLGCYLATVDTSGLQLHQYAQCSIRAALPDGRPVGLDVSTRYPVEEEIRITITEAPTDEWTLSLRVPAWATDASLEQAGQVAQIAPGSVSVTRVFSQGETLILRLPLTPRFTRADARIDAISGSVALERGPLVLCLESIDLPGATHVDQVVVDESVAPRIVDGRTVIVARIDSPDRQVWPYGTEVSEVATADDALTDDALTDVALIPYYSWANRGPSTMRVWLRTA